MDSFGPLVNGAWLKGHLGDRDLRVIDLRWYLDGRSGRDAYRAGHIPGAAFVDLEREITAAEGPGRHPIPSPAQFQAAMRRAGVSGSSRVLIYDDQGGYSAARLWWLLRYHGHPAAAILDGGIGAWEGELEPGEEAVAPGAFESAEPDPSMVIDRDGVLRAAGAVLFDARAAERYRGDLEPIDAKAGHIPGALNVPWRSNLGDDWRFLPAADLRARYAAGEGREVIVYCGSGVSAAVDLLALEVAGIRGPRLYEGSWSDWSRQELPVATGEDP